MPKSKSTSNPTTIKQSFNIEDEWMNFISTTCDENDMKDEYSPDDDLEDMNEIIKKSGETLSANLIFELVLMIFLKLLNSQFLRYFSGIE